MNLKFYRTPFIFAFITSLFSCNNDLKVKPTDDKTDSLAAVETRRIIGAFTKSNIKSEFFTLHAKPLVYVSEDLKKELESVDPTLYLALNKAIERPKTNVGNVCWTEELAPNAILISEMKFDKHHNPTLNRKMMALPGHGVYEISSPIFNKTFDIALFKYAFICGGRCAHGKLVLYKKQNKVWQEIKILANWIS